MTVAVIKFEKTDDPNWIAPLMREDGKDANYYKRLHLAQLKQALLKSEFSHSQKLATVRGSGSFTIVRTIVEDREWGWRMERHFHGREYFVYYLAFENGNGNDCGGVVWIENDFLYHASCRQEYNSCLRRHQGRIEHGFNAPCAVC